MIFALGGMPMPILKILGVILILGTGAFSAGVVIRYEKRKIAVLAGWSDLIWYIRSQIDCYLMPLPEILAGADPLPLFPRIKN